MQFGIATLENCWTNTYIPLAAAKSLQSCPTLCDPINSSPPGSPIPGILQVTTLEWVAISFSNAWKWKVKVKLLSRVQLFSTSWTAAFEAPLSMGFSRQVYWSGLPFPSPGDLPYPGIEPAPLVFPALAGGFSTTAPCGKPIPVRGINQIILLVLGISTRIGRKYIIDASCPIMITVGWYMKIRVVGKKKRTKCEYNKEIWSSPGKILLKIGNTKKIKFSWGSSIAEKTILKCTFHSTVLVWSSFLEIIIDL